MRAPPERIVLAGVGAVLRRHAIDDLDALQQAIEESRDHLRPFMPWADQSRADTAAFLDRAAAGWSTGTDFQYAIAGDGGEVLGGSGLHPERSPDGSTPHIGYWVHPEHTGRGLATAAARALTAAAIGECGAVRVEIHCDQANARSAAVARRLGYRLDRIEDRAPSSPGDLGRSMIWVCEAAP